jgi:hypothetical protein
MSASPPQRLLERIRAEYLEMPGMRLTVEQAERLCGLERALCQLMLDSLVDANFLCLKSNGAYARSTDGEIPRPRVSKAGLKSNEVEREQLSRVPSHYEPRKNLRQPA